MSLPVFVCSEFVFYFESTEFSGLHQETLFLFAPEYSLCLDYLFIELFHYSLVLLSGHLYLTQTLLLLSEGLLALLLTLFLQLHQVLPLLFDSHLLLFHLILQPLCLLHTLLFPQSTLVSECLVLPGLVF